MSPLDRLRDLNQSSSEFADCLLSILHEQGHKEWVANLQDKDPVWLVECLDNVRLRIPFTNPPPKVMQALGTIRPASPPYRKFLCELRAVCDDRGILPRPCILLEPSLNTVKWPIASRGSRDAYEWFLNDLKVCVKRLRIYSNDGPEKAKYVCYRHRRYFPLMDPHRPPQAFHVRRS
jgi:hypothetical protein